MNAFKYFLCLMVISGISILTINADAIVWDIDADGKHSLPDVIYILQSLTGVTASNEDQKVVYIKSNTTDGSTVFVDKSEAGHIISANGDVQHDFPFGLDSAILFDGTGDYLSLADSDDWDFGTEDFTIDLWVYFTSTPAESDGLFTTYNLSNSIGYLIDIHSGTLHWYDPAMLWLDTGIVPTVRHWMHVAAVRNGNILTLYVDGEAAASADCTGININSGNNGLMIGRTHTTLDTYYFDGYMDEFRISKGKARWTDNFIPPNNPGCPPDSDTDGDGFTPAEGDCNCNDPQIYPGAPEICGDGIDQNCDGEKYLACTETWTGEMTSNMGEGTGTGTLTFTKLDKVITADGSWTVQDPTYGEFELTSTGAAVSIVENTLTVTAAGTATHVYSGQTSAFTLTMEGTYHQSSANGTYSTFFTAWGLPDTGTWTSVLVSGSGITN